MRHGATVPHATLTLWWYWLNVVVDVRFCLQDSAGQPNGSRWWCA